jgi:hypothetical protein
VLIKFIGAFETSNYKGVKKSSSIVSILMSLVINQLNQKPKGGLDLEQDIEKVYFK